MWMRRRDLLIRDGAAVLLPLHGRAQQNAIVGWLGLFARNRCQFVVALHEGLSETAYVEGKTWRSSTGGRASLRDGCPLWPTVLPPKGRPDFHGRWRTFSICSETRHRPYESFSPRRRPGRGLPGCQSCEAGGAMLPALAFSPTSSPLSGFN
jgi:hypothetical protein